MRCGAVSVKFCTLTVLSTVAGDPESEEGNTVIENLPVTEGTYYLVASESETGSGGPGWWYEAIVYVATFETDSYSCP